MGSLNNKLQQLMENGQGSAGRTLDRLPSVVQESLVKVLGYPYQYPQLDSFTKCLMAAQLKQGKSGFIGDNVDYSRCFSAIWYFDPIVENRVVFGGNSDYKSSTGFYFLAITQNILTGMIIVKKGNTELRESFGGLLYSSFTCT